MAKILNWQGTGVANGAMTTSTAGTGDNAFTAVQGAVTVDANRMRCPAGTATAYTTWALGYTLTNYAVRAYVQIDAFPASGTGATALMVGEAAGAQMWRVSTGDNIQLRNGTNVVLSTGPLLAPGAQYRVEVVVSGTTINMNVYNSSGIQVHASGDKIISAGGLDTAKFGKLVTVNYGPCYLDNMAVGNTATEVGPIAPPAGLPTKFQWSGAGLANQPLTTLVKGTGDDAFMYVQGGPQVTSQAIVFPAITGTWYATAQVADATNYAVRMYVTVGSYSDRAVGLAQCYDSAEPDANPVWGVTVSPTGILQLRDAAKAVRVDGPVIAAGARFHIEVVVSAGVAKLYVWNSQELALFESAAVTVGPKAAIVQFGKSLPDVYGPLTYDDLKIVNVAAVIGASGTVTPPAASGKKIAIIGDSMMRQGGSGEALYRTELIQRGWGDSDIFFYAVDGKRIASVDSAGYTTMDNIDQARAAIGEPDVWVIALGMDGRDDDDGTTMSNLGVVLSAIGTARKVIWVNVGLADAGNADVLRRNEVIQSTMFVRGGPSKTADWFSWIHDGRDETDLWHTTGIALTSDGFRERIRFIGQVVGMATASQPTATATAARTVEPWGTVSLVGADSDTGSTVIGRQWRQIAGTPVALQGSGNTRYYQAPPSNDGFTLRFGYKVTNAAGQESPEYLVNQRVLPINERAIIGGQEVYIRLLQPQDAE